LRGIGERQATNFGDTTVENRPDPRSGGIKLHGDVAKVQNGARAGSGEDRTRGRHPVPV